MIDRLKDATPISYKYINELNILNLNKNTLVIMILYIFIVLPDRFRSPFSYGIQIQSKPYSLYVILFFLFYYNIRYIYYIYYLLSV